MPIADLPYSGSSLRPSDFGDDFKTMGWHEGMLTSLVAVAKGSLAMVETDPGTGHTAIGTIEGIGYTPGYGNPTLLLKGLYEDARPSGHYGFKMGVVILLDGHAAGRFKVLDHYRGRKTAAMEAVRATLEKDDAWAGKWRMTPFGRYVDVTRERLYHVPGEGVKSEAGPKDYWRVNDGGHIETVTYGGPCAPLFPTPAFTKEA